MKNKEPKLVKTVVVEFFDDKTAIMRTSHDVCEVESKAIEVALSKNKIVKSKK